MCTARRGDGASPLLPLPSAAWWQVEEVWFGLVWWGGFVAAVSQSVCQGKSSLTSLTSSPHEEGGAGGTEEAIVILCLYPARLIKVSKRLARQRFSSC